MNKRKQFNTKAGHSGGLIKSTNVNQSNPIVVAKISHPLPLWPSYFPHFVLEIQYCVCFNRFYCFFFLNFETVSSCVRGRVHSGTGMLWCTHMQRSDTAFSSHLSPSSGVIKLGRQVLFPPSHLTDLVGSLLLLVTQS